MPNFNQTGPNGQGPMTGRGMGRCADNVPEKQNDETIQNSETNENIPGDMMPGMGMARRRRFMGGGRGRGGFGPGRGKGRGRW